MTSELLRLEGLHAGYMRIEVIHGIDLRVDQGEFVAVIGANGAGKSTLLKSVAGLLRPQSGVKRLNGRDVTSLRPEQLVSAGVSLVPEGRMLFGPMTVRQNLEIGAYSAGGRRRGAEVRTRLDRVHSLFPVLQERSEQRADTLSGGEQ